MQVEKMKCQWSIHGEISEIYSGNSHMDLRSGILTKDGYISIISDSDGHKPGGINKRKRSSLTQLFLIQQY